MATNKIRMEDLMSHGLDNFLNADKTGDICEVSGVTRVTVNLQKFLGSYLSNLFVDKHLHPLSYYIEKDPI